MKINHVQAKLIAAFSIGGVAGAAAGYFFTKRHMEERLEREVQDVKDNYRLLRKDDYESPTDYVEKVYGDDEQGGPQLPPLDINQIVEHQKLNDEMVEKVEPYRTGSVFNAFENSKKEQEQLPPDAEDALYDTLVSQRTDDKPFLISVDEFHDEMIHYSKISITYFKGDNIVAYEDDSMMLDPDTSFDLINLSRFGIKSNDPNIVYVRNPLMDIDYEIVLDEGKFADVMARINGNSGDDA